MAMDKKVFSKKPIHQLMTYKADMMIVDGPRGCGKTVETIQICLERFEAGKGHFVWIRDDEEGIEQAFGKDGTKMSRNLSYNYPDRPNVVSVQKDMVYIDGKHCGYALRLSTPEKFKGGGYEPIGTVVYDEFVEEGHSRKRKIKGKMELIMSLLESVARTADIKVFMLANRFSLYNEVYQYFQFKSAPGTKVERSPRKYINGNGNLIDLGKDVISAHLEPLEYIQAKRETFLGRIAGASDYGKFMYDNMPMDSSAMTFKKLPNDVKSAYNFRIGDSWFSLWFDGFNNYYIRNGKVEGIDNKCLDVSEVSRGASYIGDKSVTSLRNKIKEGKMLFCNNTCRQKWFEAIM